MMNKQKNYKYPGEKKVLRTDNYSKLLWILISVYLEAESIGGNFGSQILFLWKNAVS